MDEFVIFYNAILYEIDRLKVLSDFLNSKSDAEILKPEYSYLIKLSHPFFEIRDSLDRLTKISKYISWSPNTKNINYRYDMLRYHYENYCHELYILKQRLIAFLNIIKRLYKNEINNNSIVLQYSKLYTLISETMNDFIQERSLHVHERRMSNPEIKNFSLLSFLLNEDFKKYPGLQNAFFQDDYKKLKKEYSKIVKERNLIIDDLVDKIFSKINSIILVENTYIAKPKV